MLTVMIICITTLHSQKINNDLESEVCAALMEWNRVLIPSKITLIIIIFIMYYVLCIIIIIIVIIIIIIIFDYYYIFNIYVYFDM